MCFVTLTLADYLASSFNNRKAFKKILTIFSHRRINLCLTVCVYLLFKFQSNLNSFKVSCKITCITQTFNTLQAKITIHSHKNSIESCISLAEYIFNFKNFVFLWSRLDFNFHNFVLISVEFLTDFFRHYLMF